MAKLSLPGARIPLLDERGVLNTVWYRYFNDLFTRVGEGDSEGLAELSAAFAVARSQFEAADPLQVQSNAGLAQLARLIESFQDGLLVAATSRTTDQALEIVGHGVQADPALHAVASTADHGFMSAADKVRLDGMLAATQISRFGAFQSAAQAIGASAFATILFQTEEFDDLAEYNPATGVFTAAASGSYVFAAGLHGSQTAATNRALSIYVNGTERKRLQQNISTPGNGVIAGNSGVISLTAGDLVTVRYFSGIAENTTIGQALTYFSGWRIK